MYGSIHKVLHCVMYMYDVRGFCTVSVHHTLIIMLHQPCAIFMYLHVLYDMNGGDHFTEQWHCYYHSGLPKVHCTRPQGDHKHCVLNKRLQVRLLSIVLIFLVGILERGHF